MRLRSLLSRIAHALMWRSGRAGRADDQVSLWMDRSLQCSRTMPEGDARWIADPTRRHELRWWNGARWTQHVSDRGIVGEDWGPKGPPAPPPRPQQDLADDDVGDPRGLLEESPRRQRERERRRTLLTIAAAILMLAVAIAVAVAVSSS
jgi:Protein of unknown function (DUF2510)